MAFKKGHSGNPTGRKKGTPNKTTKDIREIMSRIVSSNFSESKITRDLKELSPKQRLDYLLRLTEFILPKPKSIEPEELKQLTMEEKYSRITAYINSSFNVNGENKKNNANKSNMESLVHIIPEGSQSNDYET